MNTAILKFNIHKNSIEYGYFFNDYIDALEVAKAFNAQLKEVYTKTDKHTTIETEMEFKDYYVEGTIRVEQQPICSDRNNSLLYKIFVFKELLSLIK